MGDTDRQMLGAANRRYVLGLCLMLASCGRIGVHVLTSEFEPGPEEEPLPNEPDAGTEPVSDAGEELMDGGDATTTGDAGDDASMQLDAGGQLDTGTQGDTGTQLDTGTQSDAGDADSGTQDAGDAAAPADAAPTDAGTDASLPACSGARALNLCWYLGALGASCEQTCSARGGYDVRATGIVGTTGQGGSLSNCTQVLTALGHAGSVGAGSRDDGIGLGCHTWDVDGWWLQTMPDFDPNASYPPARIACGCVR